MSQKQKALYITDWEKHYETNSDCGRWLPKQKKRVKPHEYIRLYVLGPSGDNMAYQEVADAVAEKFGEDAWIVAWGLFIKLLELAGRNNFMYRGYILGKNRSPISPRMLQIMTCFTESQINRGIEILCDSVCGWVHYRDVPEENTPSADSANGPDAAADSPPLQEAKAKAKVEEEVKAKDESERQPEEPRSRSQKPSPVAPLPCSPSHSQPQAALPLPHQYEPTRFAFDICSTAGATMTDFNKHTLAKICRLHVNTGHLGPRAREDCIEQVRAFKSDPTAKNPLSLFINWVRQKVEANGYVWDRWTDRRDADTGQRASGKTLARAQA